MSSFAAGTLARIVREVGLAITILTILTILWIICREPELAVAFAWEKVLRLPGVD